MTAESLDPRREKLIAALYGELSHEEEEAFQRLLETDEALRAEWQELSEARAFLETEVLEERAPSFVFLESAEGRSPRRRGAGFASLWAALRGPVLGFGLGAAALLVLMLSGLHIERSGGALVVGFGERGPATASAPTPEMTIPAQLAGSGVPIEPNAHEGGPSDGVYLTRAEFTDYSDQLVQAVSAGLTEYEKKRNDELRYLLSGIYADLEARQEHSWKTLNDRFAEAWVYLAAANASGATRLEAPGAREGFPPSGAGDETPQNTMPEGH